MRYLLCHYIKECYKNKWIAPIDGNLSFKPANSNFFYITPASLRKHEINNDDIVKIFIDYENNKITIDNKSNRTASGELELHSNILTDKKFKNTNLCVVHVHPPYILAYIGLRKNRELKTILELFPELNIKIGNNVPYITAKTSDLAQKTYENINNVNNENSENNDHCKYCEHNEIVALRNHGVVCIGKNFQKVMEIIETLEYYCKIALLDNNL